MIVSSPAQMRKYRPVFFEYRMYRIKFLKIVGFAAFISTIVFAGVLVFLMNTWMNDLWKQTQDVFTTKERILGDIRLRTLDFGFVPQVQGWFSVF